MNALSPISPRRPKPRREDQEFLAPALEVLETPPSPVRMALIIAICALAASALIWAYMGRIDIIATAQGKIEPTGKVKVIQPVVTGKVSDIRVANGDHVTAGEAVAVLDGTEAQAQLDDLQTQLMAARAEVLMRRAAIADVDDPSKDKDGWSRSDIVWTNEISPAVRDREEGIFLHDLGQLGSQLQGIDSQIAQKSGDAKSLDATIAAQQSLLDTLFDLERMHKALADNGTGSRADWLSAVQALKTQKVALATDRSQKTDDVASIDVLARQRSMAKRTFVADYMQKLATAEGRVDQLSEQVRQAQAQLDHLTLRSPVDGVVQALSLTTIGQVVTVGEEVMHIVPQADEIDIEAYLPNSDVGFVKVGLPVSVKIAAFPYTQFGTVPGTIVRLGKDAVSASDAQKTLADASSIFGGATGGADITQGLMFPIGVRLDSKTIKVGDASIPLSPGMSVSVDIDTGSRRILEFVLSPLVDVTSGALHER